jgi:integral membrane protein
MNAVRSLRLAGILEGISYLLLLFIAMPLKYAAGLPMAVRIVGSMHGLLFLWFLSALLRAHLERRWGLKVSTLVFIASLLPFGFLAIDRTLKREMARAAQTAE